MAFQLVQFLFWLSLSTWFGVVLFIAAAAPVIFRTVREANPILPSVLSVNLQGQHGTLLAGSIVHNLLSHLKLVQAVAAGLLLVAMVLQSFLIDLSGTNGSAALVRWGLWLAAAGVLLYDWLAIAPKLARFRKQYVDHADEPEIANPAKENFDRLHQRSVTGLQVLLFFLLGMILFSGSITPKSRGTPIHGTSLQSAN
ncbi:MAG: hypothetical protein NZ561_05775 [Phycisphaerae bacterium]|nr:hypothetical protein [Phycisphaerae bacterium]MDW8262778.1 hypothetical protein [Phycisphaerales bacterium]